MNTDTELKPCPAEDCGNEVEIFVGDVDRPTMRPFGTKHGGGTAVFCGICGLRGPVARTDQEAKEFWNALPRRANTYPTKLKSGDVMTAYMLQLEAERKMRREAIAKEMAEFIVEHGDELTFGNGLKKEYVDSINAVIDKAQEYLMSLPTHDPI